MPPSPAPKIPPAPESPDALLAWAARHHVQERLDDLFIGSSGPPGTLLPGRPGEELTYREALLSGRQRNRWSADYLDVGQGAREFLQRIATLTAQHRHARFWMDQHGRDPEDQVLSAFLEKLRAELRALSASEPQRQRRAVGTYEPLRVQVTRAPIPMLGYEEVPLNDLYAEGEADHATCVLLLGWGDGEAPLRWTRTVNGEPVASAISPDERQSALEAMIDFIRDPGEAAEQEALAELLRVPTWRFALGTLDETLARLDSSEPARPRGKFTSAPEGINSVETRVAFRVTVYPDDRLDVGPVIQKRGRAGVFSKGSRLEWFNLPYRSGLSAIERRAYQAHEDRFAREADGGRHLGSRLTGAQLFGIFRALLDHPAVFLDRDRSVVAGQRSVVAENGSPLRTTTAENRLEIRQGRMRLRFVTASDGGVTPFFELVGSALSPPEAERALADDAHVIHLHHPADQPPQILLAQITPQAAAVVRALALAPAQFPADAHDALAARLESLQEAMDIEFPSHWTRTIGPADGRLVARLELLGSGAVQVRLRIRPVKLGPVFPPGEGPVLVLEGQGRDRHGARRDPQAERQNGHALAERLGLGGGEEVEPWCWRVGEGDPALQLVDTLKELSEPVAAPAASPGAGADQQGGDGTAAAAPVAAAPAPAVVVEWADDERLIALGSVGRGDMRMKVADRRDWFGLEGGAAVKRKGKAKKLGSAREPELVPLADLLAAIREERRYVRVGSHGFVRIEQSLRDALARAEGAVFAHGAQLQISSVAHDTVMGLVEAEAQVEASAAFVALRRRMKEGADLTPRLSPDLERQLRPYQKAGVEWMTRLSHWGAGAILADEMGLGKTIQTLAVLLHRAGDGPALVVAPTSVVGNWVDEAARFVPSLKVRLHRGPGRDTAMNGLGPGDLVITSYAIATLDSEGLARHRFASLVLDEAQAIKNATTERAKALRGLNAEWRLGLTGTPIENHLGELWSLLRVISPGLMGSWEQFRGRYAVPIEKFGDQTRRKSLSALLHPFMLRRLKSEVARDLPPRTEVVKTLSLSEDEQKLYEELRLATLAEIASKKQDPDRDGQDLRFVLLAALTRLRQLCCHPRLVYPRTHAGSTKAAYLVHLLEELREDGHKALVFSQFRSFLDLLEPRLTQHGFRVLVLDGTTPAEVREKRIAAFQAGEADLFLISLKAGGFGLNLTAADTVIHLDPWWNPAVEDQATARAHRMGQQRPVTAVRLVARGTIEEAVLGLHAAKRALASAVLEGTDIAGTLGTEELVDLIRRGATPPP